MRGFYSNGLSSMALDSLNLLCPAPTISSTCVAARPTSRPSSTFQYSPVSYGLALIPNAFTSTFFSVWNQ